MGREKEEIQARIKELVGVQPGTIQATVKEVNEEEFTCTIDLDQDLLVEDVRLRAVIDSNLPGFAFIPTLESKILITRLRTGNEFFVSQFSEIDKFILVTGDTKWTLDQDQVELLKGEDDEVKMFFDSSVIEMAVKDQKFKMSDGAVEIETKKRSIKIDDIITLNGGQKGSYLTDINQLVSKLNRLENAVNGLKQVLAVWVPVPMDGGAVLKAAVTSWAAQLLQPVTNVNDLKDDKVKH